MPSLLPLAAQTTDAEIVDLCTTADIDATFPPNGSFVATIAKGRRYWYNPSGATDASSHQSKKYARPDNEYSGRLVARYGAANSSYRRRHSVVAALKRFGLPAPADETGKILRNRADQGIFRLCSCVVGSVAYQTHGGLLGVKLTRALPQTGDLDWARPCAIPIAIAKDEKIAAIFDIRQIFDSTFRAGPYLCTANAAANYMLLPQPSERLRTAKRRRTGLRAQPSPSPSRALPPTTCRRPFHLELPLEEALDQAVDLLERRCSSSQRTK